MTMVETQALCSGYGNEVVISGIDIQAEAGKTTIIIGPNGCGKSTLLKTIAGDIKPYAGIITIDGHNSGDIKNLARLISVVEQGSKDIDMSVADYVKLGRTPHKSLFCLTDSDEDRKATQKAIETTGVTHLTDKKLCEISDGERQLCEIAKALAQDTPILLLDEPTSNLDIGNRQKTMGLLEDIASQGKCVICVIHDINEAMLWADNLIIMKGGKVVTQGTPEKVASQEVLSDAFGTNIGITTVQNGEQRIIIPQKRK